MTGSVVEFPCKGGSMRRIICLLVVLTTPLLLTAGPEDVRRELAALQGKWKTVAVEALGKPFPSDAIPAFTFIVGADGKSIGQMPKGEFRFTMTVDPRRFPKTIENLHETGEEKGKRQYGIYKLEGDRFIVCMTRAGAAEADRPKDFITTKDTSNVVFVFERVREDKRR
jgi:uncharacterized protein (TIGR03067 family)